MYYNRYSFGAFEPGLSIRWKKVIGGTHYRTRLQVARIDIDNAIRRVSDETAGIAKICSKYSNGDT